MPMRPGAVCTGRLVPRCVSLRSAACVFGGGRRGLSQVHRTARRRIYRTDIKAGRWHTQDTLPYYALPAGRGQLYQHTLEFRQNAVANPTTGHLPILDRARPEYTTGAPLADTEPEESKKPQGQQNVFL